MIFKEGIEFIYIDNTEFPEGFNPIIMNRALSFNNLYLDVASDVDINLFRKNDKITAYQMKLKTENYLKIPFIPYIKELKEKIDEFNFLWVKIKKYYGISNSDVEFIKKILVKKFEDKTILREYFMFFGIERKYYKKYKLPLEEVKKKEIKGLGDFI